MANKPKDNTRGIVNLYMEKDILIEASDRYKEITGVSVGRGQFLEMLCKKYLEDNQPVEKTTTT